ncbi:hypothetical protein ACH5RR_003950 [Cinchona calisaya]|uniref:Uncharacterized protein n=1 Tax=Cinchona calisaya TaxID=153742 RepID=A0ABD3AWX9_9GENT
MLDVGETGYQGNYQHSFSNLQVLSLRSNEFDGTIPPNLCHLSRIQILDLSNNKTFGSIPNCLNNLTAMTQVESATKTLQINALYYLDDTGEFTFVFHYESAFVMWQGENFEYKNTLGLLKVIDLSSNNLTGAIPLEITSLFGLLVLNLSRNNLSGYIPPSIGQFSALNVLDLSRNSLFGSIPPSLSQFSHLGVQDLSYNNLSGRIPMTTRLQTFNASTYIGNSELCGIPLSKSCPPNTVPDEQPNVTSSIDHKEPEDAFKTNELFISIAIGFFFGFWGVFGSFLLGRSCWYALVGFVNNIGDWLYVTIAIQKAKMQRKCENGKHLFFSSFIKVFCELFTLITTDIVIIKRDSNSKDELTN